MFEEIPFILGFMIFSVIFSYVALKYVPPPFSEIIKGLAIVGIVIHELCHYLMCIITRSPIEKVTLIKKLDFKEEQRLGYYGEVQVQEHRISFLQAVLIGLAPLYLSFWLFFFLLNILVYSPVEPVVFIICIFVMISISLSAAPSFADFLMIPKVFLNDFNHSMYQVLLIALSFLLTITMLTVFDLQSFHEFFVYLIITGFYFGFKYGFQITGNLLYKNSLVAKTLSNRNNFKRYSRRRHNPEKKRHSYYNTN
ncbi:MAG: hypothetical protein ACXAC5_22870 [Promethearchaeota archaeon]|jgi:hypothetical protein